MDDSRSRPHHAFAAESEVDALQHAVRGFPHRRVGHDLAVLFVPIAAFM